MIVKKIIRFVLNNYIVSIVLVIVFFVGIFAFQKVFISKPLFVYAKIKVSQGLWWAITQRPTIWQVDAIQKGDTARDFLGEPIAEVLSKKYYRYFNTDQFDIYVTMRLKVKYNNKTRTYNYDRASIAVGTPVNIPLQIQELTGTVTELSKQPFNENLVEKTITLTKKYAYSWEYDAIKIGDSYFDGEDTIFEIIEKNNQQGNGMLSYSSYFYNNGSPVVEPSNFVTVKAKVKLRKIGKQWVLGEDRLISVGSPINISTSNYVFDNYIIVNIE